MEIGNLHYDMTFEKNDSSLKHPTQNGAGESSKNLVTFQNFNNIV